MPLPPPPPPPPPPAVPAPFGAGGSGQAYATPTQQQQQQQQHPLARPMAERIAAMGPQEVRGFLTFETNLLFADPAFSFSASLQRFDFFFLILFFLLPVLFFFLDGSFRRLNGGVCLIQFLFACAGSICSVSLFSGSLADGVRPKFGRERGAD